MTTPVAIIGIGCIFPKADNLESYWANICNRVDAITDVPPTHWQPGDYLDQDPKAPDRVYVARGGFISPVDFSPLEFGISPNTLEAIDTTQLLGLIASRQALEDAGYGTGDGLHAFDRNRVGVILGVTGTLEMVIPLGARLGHPIWRRALKEAGVADAVAEDVVRRIADSYVGWQEDSFPGLLGNVAAGRIANRLDLGGTNCVVDAACASSLGAIHLAMLELESGRADMVLSGGLDTFNDIFMYMCFSKTPALSPTGNAKPFDAKADGTILGEGLGVVVLKRYADAVRDGDKIYAVIRGIGTSSDGKGNAIYAPSPAGQAKALREAYRQAGVTSDTIELIEAHGTGTRAGDVAELTALTEVYKEARGEGRGARDEEQKSAIGNRQSAIGSVKSQIGHTKAAAGAAGLIKAALALHHKVLPPTIKVDQPLDILMPGHNGDPASPFYVNTEKRPWLPSADHPRRAAVSSFGFGGSNFHCVLEEHSAEKTSIDWDGNVQIVAFSAPTREALHNALANWPAELSWEELRRKAARSRAEFSRTHPYRLIMVVERGAWSVEREAWGEEALARARQMLEKHRDKPSWDIPETQGVRIFFGSGQPSGKLGMIFPGQGSQYVGMLRDLACHFPQMHRTLANVARGAWCVAREDSETAAHPSPLAPRPSPLVFIYPQPAFRKEERVRNEELLRATEVAQPAIGTVSLGALRVLEHFGVRAEAVAGHSYGELVALCAAGRLDEEAFFFLSRERGRLMAECGAGNGADKGSMLAVRAALNIVETVLRDESLDLVIANKNAPAQFVLSGATAEINRAAEAFARRNIPARPLPVSAAFHSRFVADARRSFEDALTSVEFREGVVPVFANSTARQYPHNPQEARALLAGQLAQPVEFIEEIENMYGFGVRTFVEVGPGNKLAGLMRAILEGRDPSAVVFAVDASSGKRSGFYDLACILAQLSALGHAVQLPLWDEAFAKHAETQPTEKKKTLTVSLSGANYVKNKGVRGQGSGVGGQGSGVRGQESGVRNQESGVGLPQPAAQARENHNNLPQSAAQAKLPQPAAQARIVQQQTEVPMEHKTSEERNEGQRTKDKGQEKMFKPVPVDISEQPEGVLSRTTHHAPRTTHSDALRLTQENLLALQKLGEQTAQLHQQFLSGQDKLLQAFQTLLGQQQHLLERGEGRGARGEEENGRRGEGEKGRRGDRELASRERHSPEIERETQSMERETRNVEQDSALSTQHSALSTQHSALVPPASSLQSPASSLLLEVVSEKTGYPPEMLELDMELDSDLGIDSIKRVEIFSALQERMPEAPTISAEHLGTLRTLRQVVAFLDEGRGARGEGRERSGQWAVGSGQELDSAQHSALSTQHSALATSAYSLQPTAYSLVLLEVVSEKTGYPPEMLELDMELDSDLGIDSIKRVEIFSALQERMPEAPTISAEHLGTLRTLRQVVAFLEEGRGTRGEGRAEEGEKGRRGERETASRERQRPEAERETQSNRQRTTDNGHIQRLVLSAVPLDDETRTAVSLPEGGEIWITEDDSALASSLAGRLSALGYRPRLVFLKDRRSLAKPAALAGLVIVAPPSGVGDDFLKEAFQLLQFAGPGLRQTGKTSSSAFVTVSRMDGSFGLEDWRGDPLTGGLAGLAKTVHHEWPEVHCKALDLDAAFHDADEAALWIVDEMLLSGPVEVGISQHGRRTLQLRETEWGVGNAKREARLTTHHSPLTTHHSPLTTRDVVLVTGGARGVTAEVAVALARAFAPTLVLLGRSPEPTPEPDWLAPLTTESEIKRALLTHANGTPEKALSPKEIEEQYRQVSANREVQRTLARIEAAGARVVYRGVDVRDAQSLSSLLTVVRAELGPIRGLIHGAGVLADRLIEDKTEEQFERVYATKVTGLRALLRELEEEDLKLLVLFSSTTGRLGRAGQVDYAMANEVLNKLAQEQARRRPACRVLSVNWGPWDGGMVTPSLKKVFENEGVGLIPLEAGAEYLIREISQTEDRPVEVVVLGEGVRGQGSGVRNQESLASGGRQPSVEESALSTRHSTHGTGALGLQPTAYSLQSLVTLAFEREVGLEQMPVLRSHVLDGRAVLPMALMVEWLAHGALHGNPGLMFHGFDELRVLKGVRLEEDQTRSIRVLAGRAVKDGSLYRVPVEMRGSEPNGREVLHAAADIILAERLPSSVNRLSFRVERKSEIGNRQSEILFHGPDLQGIGQVEGCSVEGIAAFVSSAPPPSAWIKQPMRHAWLADPLVLDCAFQMMILWSFENHGAGSLPCHAGRYRQYRRAFPREGVRVVAAVTKNSDRRALANIDFLDQAGEVIARMEDYECVVDASLNEAFRRNTLASEAVP